MPEVWEVVQQYVQQTQTNGYFQQRRQAQNLHWLYEAIRHGLEERFYARPEVQAHLTSLRQQVISGQKSAFGAAGELLEL